MADFPNYLILPEKIYSVSYKRLEGGRAFERILVDFGVVGTNVFNEKDCFRARLGVTDMLAEDYKSFKENAPLEWLLGRFLVKHVRSNSVDTISGSGGEVLTTKNYKDFLGITISNNDAESVLASTLSSWMSVLPGNSVKLADLFCASNLEIGCLKGAINRLKSMGAVIEEQQDTFKIDLLALRNIVKIQEKSTPSLDRRNNRYFQQIEIAAKEPFCFVIMPFRETEFPQRIYTEVIKPYIQDTFRINCYRVDEDGIPDRIDNKIYSYMLHSSFVISELTTLNPNVLYELGLAHMLEKNCLILTQKHPEKLPFDIKHFSVKEYKNDDELREILNVVVSALGFKQK